METITRTVFTASAAQKVHSHSFCCNAIIDKLAHLIMHHNENNNIAPARADFSPCLGVGPISNIDSDTHVFITIKLWLCVRLDKMLGLKSKADQAWLALDIFRWTLSDMTFHYQHGAYMLSDNDLQNWDTLLISTQWQWCLQKWMSATAPRTTKLPFLNWKIPSYQQYHKNYTSTCMLYCFGFLNNWLKHDCSPVYIV